MGEKVGGLCAPGASGILSGEVHAEVGDCGAMPEQASVDWVSAIEAGCPEMGPGTSVVKYVL